MVRINIPPTNPYIYHKNQFIQANNNINNNLPKYSFAKNYIPGNITHFNNGKVLRHQEHEARKYLEGNNSRNQFEDMHNGTSLYDDIVNKLSLRAVDKYRQARNGNHEYENDMLNGYNNRHQAMSNNNNSNKVYMSNRQNIGNYHIVNPGQVNNVTITTRINNGKLESEV